MVRELPLVTRVIALSVENDCKEILAVVDDAYSDTSLEAVNISKSGESKFCFTKGEEEGSGINIKGPAKYLYEPNSSILKLGAFKVIGRDFAVHKLHPNSHLYSSDEVMDDFPGRVFEIKSSQSFAWGHLKSLRGKQANITIRNFPHSVETIRKKTGILDGGEDYIFFTRTMAGLLYLTCHKVR